MTKLLIHLADCEEEASAKSTFGGKPSAPDGKLGWPVCRSCSGNMQFLGQLQAPEHQALFLLFMCGNDPGMCDEWAPDSGGNAVLVVPHQRLRLVEPPMQGDTTRATCCEALIIERDEDDYESSKSSWVADNGASPRKVLGQIGGRPSWIQGDETPQCEFCGKAMRLFAQLEQGPDWKTEMNFGGGGCAYVFSCACNEAKAKMLWQC